MKHINKLSIDTNTVAHIKEDTRPTVNVHNIEKDKYLPERSFMVVTYSGNKYDTDNSVKLYLDHSSAKALAEGIMAKLDEMKYDQ
ncbi:MAG: hypothetical protein PHY77_04245 [Desulfotomaculaceae bacterium]|nr:hypothetical protein [Desulfotomaculaceae bacterium]